MDLAQTLWIAFDKKQPTTEKFIDWVQEMEICNVFEYPYNADWRLLQLIFDFNNHLQNIVTIEMLVAMKEGKGREKPEFPTENRSAHDGLAELYDYQLKEYEKAMESVLYEDFGQRIMDNAQFEVLNGNGVTKISEMNNAEITLNWWKEVLK